MHTNTRTVDKAAAVLFARLGMRGLLKWDRKSGRINECLVWSSLLIPSSLEGQLHRVNTNSFWTYHSFWRVAFSADASIAVAKCRDTCFTAPCSSSSVRGATSGVRRTWKTATPSGLLPQIDHASARVLLPGRNFS